MALAMKSSPGQHGSSDNTLWVADELLSRSAQDLVPDTSGKSSPYFPCSDFSSHSLEVAHELCQAKSKFQRDTTTQLTFCSLPHKPHGEIPSWLSYLSCSTPGFSWTSAGPVSALPCPTASHSRIWAKTGWRKVSQAFLPRSPPTISHGPVVPESPETAASQHFN